MADKRTFALEQELAFNGNRSVLVDHPSFAEAKRILESTLAKVENDIAPKLSGNLDADGFSIFSVGNVGIGIAAPNAELEIFSSIQQKPRLRITSTSTQIATHSGISFYGSTGNASFFAGGLFRRADSDMIGIWTADDGSAPKLTIERDTGNVGIRIDEASPGAQLHVLQISPSGSQPVALFHQKDVDQEFINFTIDTDQDMVLIKLSVTGNPTINWDESEDAFSFDKGIRITSGALEVGTPETYTPSNVSTDRSYDADATSVAELADVLGTLIADLQATGLVN